MTSAKRASTYAVYRALILGLAGLAVSCLPVTKLNKLPVARIDVQLGGQSVSPSLPIPFDGQPVTVVLDGASSTDPDGSIVEYRWMRTDVSAAARFGLPADMGAAGAGAAAAPAFTGDPVSGPGPTTQVTLTEKGKYRFSLWVRDNDNAFSAPASVSLTVGGFTPDQACVAAYTQPNADCQACACTPDAMGGCLDEFNRCFNNPDPQFTTLCSAVINCATAKKCSGAACYTADLCMAEIDAAGAYMGGSVATCAMVDMADANPCAASSVFGTCTGMTMCATVCQ